MNIIEQIFNKIIIENVNNDDNTDDKPDDKN